MQVCTGLINKRGSGTHLQRDRFAVVTYYAPLRTSRLARRRDVPVPHIMQTIKCVVVGDGAVGKVRAC